MLFNKKFNKVGNSPHFKMMPTVLLSLLLIITVAFLTGMAAIFPKREVVIYDEGIKVCSLHTSSSDFEKIVKENLPAKPFQEKDSYDVNEKNNNLCEINVKRGFNLNVNILGETKNVKVAKGTKVLDVLKELNVEPKEDLYITPDLETVVEPNTKIEVIKVERKKQEVREVELPFETKYVLDASLKKEEKKLGQKGVKGKKEVFVEEIYSNGNLIKKEPKEIIITPAVDEIFHVGDLNLNKKNEKQKENKKNHPINNNAAVQSEGPNTITIDGKTYEYTRKMTGAITAYPATLGNTSRMGHARRGVVAADPKKFPYGTRLYIPGYGICVVGDLCGAACKGKVLVDVCFSTEKECRVWGRKTLPVYVLK